MFTRVFLNITKHKLLNALLVLLFIISFLFISFSTVFVYKTSKFIDEVSAGDEFIVYMSDDYLSEEIDRVNVFDYDIETYYNLSEEIDNYDVKARWGISVANLTVEGLDMDYTEEPEYYAAVLTDPGYISDYDGGANENEDKVIVTTTLANDLGISEGDTIVVEAMDFSSEDFTSTEIPTVEIGEVVVDIIEDGDSESGYMDEYIYIPAEQILEFKSPILEIGSAEISVTGSEEEIDKLYESTKGYSNELAMYNSKIQREKDLEFFFKIKNFFIVTLILSVVVFVVSFLSLNNNIMDRRKEELRLYNVFGVSSKSILLQLIIEKLVLLVISLIISIALLWKVLNVGSVVVDNLVTYTLMTDMVYASLIYLVGYQDIAEMLYNGVSEIDISIVLVTLFSLGILVLSIISVTIVKFGFEVKSLVNQRRGE